MKVVIEDERPEGVRVLMLEKWVIKGDAPRKVRISIEPVED
ncbi:MAG: hypothetical protein ACE5H4_13545 [Candidatus Thorarchaeota archaeon]